MKQLSSSELNNMSKEELAAMVLQMQQLHQQLQQQQKEMELQQKKMELQIQTLNEKIAIMNARHFGRSTEKLETLPGQMNIFNETEVAAAEAIAEPAIEQVVVRQKKKKGQRKEDLSRLPKRIENHELTKEQLKAIFGENGWKRLPDEVYSRVEYQPAVKEVVEHHVAVYAARKNDVDAIVRADRPVDLLRNSIATPSLVAAIMNAKYTNAIPLYRIAQDFEQSDMILGRATMANWVIRCAERYLSLVYDRLRTELCKRHVLQVDETTCQVTKDGRSSNTKSYMFVYRTSEHCQEKVKPLVEAYFAWVREQEPATILSEKTRDGLKYSLNQEEYLKVFLEDGRIPIDNSATERAIRPFTVGRANWHI